MKIFIAGASGFIGGALARSLGERGHTLICAVHSAGVGPAVNCHCLRVDFLSDVEPSTWTEPLKGVDVLINAVGLLRETRRQSFEKIHVRAPVAMFTAAVSAGCQRIIQISALGADQSARSRYHLSKKAADDFLTGLPIDWVIVRPSLVYGPGGGSARLFTTMASLPWIPIPARGNYEVQPIHRDDLVEAIVSLTELPVPQKRTISLVGPAPLPFEDFLAQLRHGLGLPPARFIHLPRGMMNVVAMLGSLARNSVLDRETMEMLYRGNAADARATCELLRRAPRPVKDFVPGELSALERSSAQLRWLLPLLRWSLALVWIVSGLVSLAVHPLADSFALLARAGAPMSAAPFVLVAAATLDILLGLACVLRGPGNRLWLLQIAVIVVYTGVISLRLPEFWLHPYGPVVKNLPMLAAIWLIHELEKR